MPLTFRNGIREHQGDERREQAAQDQRRPEGKAALHHQERVRVRADDREPHLAQRDLVDQGDAAEAADQQDVDGEQGQDRQPVYWFAGRSCGMAKTTTTTATARRPEADDARSYSWPRSPLGLNRRTRMTMTRGATDATAEPKKTGTTPSMRPRIRPPMTAPGMLPSPPKHDDHQTLDHGQATHVGLQLEDRAGQRAGERGQSAADGHGRHGHLVRVDALEE